MAKDKDTDDVKELRERIRVLIAPVLQGFRPEDVAGVLSKLAADYLDLVQIPTDPKVKSLERQSSSGWAERITSKTIRPIRASDDKKIAGSYDIYLKTDTEIASALHQILTVGAVLVSLEGPPELNSLIALQIHFPDLHLHIESPGRVVHISKRGIAVEVSQLAREDRVSLEEIFDEYKLLVDEIDANMSISSEATQDTAGQEEIAPGRVGEPSRTGRNFGSASPAGRTIPVGGPGRMPVRDTAAITSLGTRRLEWQSRRQVDLTDPDVKVLENPGVEKGPAPRTFYGPELTWYSLDVTPDREEELADDRIVDILLQLSEHGFTGVMEYSASRYRRQVMFDGGLVVEIARKPRHPDEEVGLMLFRADRIKEQQLEMAAAHAEEFKISIARSLLELDVLDPERLRHAIAGRLAFLMREMAGWGEGKIQVFGLQHLPPGFLPSPPLRVHMAVERILFQNLYDQLSQLASAERESQAAEFLDAYPEIVPEERDRVEHALRDDRHRRLVERLLLGRRRLQEVYTESELAHGETHGVIMGLHRMGLMRFDRSFHTTVVRERYREHVTVKYLSVHKASYFEVLNVHWSSYDSVVEKAYTDLIVQFDPEAVPDEMDPEVHTRVFEIRDRIESAYQVLARRETRHAYRKRIMPEYKLSHAVPLFLKQSELAERRREWQDALDAALRVLELDPSHKRANYCFERIQGVLDERISPNAADSSF